MKNSIIKYTKMEQDLSASSIRFDRIEREITFEDLYEIFKNRLMKDFLNADVALNGRASDL